MYVCVTGAEKEDHSLSIFLALLMSKLMMLISSLLFLEEMSVLISFRSWSSCFLEDSSVCMYVCIHVRMYECMYISMYVHLTHYHIELLCMYALLHVLLPLLTPYIHTYKEKCAPVLNHLGSQVVTSPGIVQGGFLHRGGSRATARGLRRSGHPYIHTYIQVKICYNMYVCRDV